jgi:hypothetical protein
MDRRDSQKRREAGREALPADDQTAILFLEPRKRALGSEAGHIALDRSPTWGLGLPYPFWNLRPDASCAQLPAQGFAVYPLSVAMTFRRFRGPPACRSGAGPHPAGGSPGPARRH